MDERALLQRLSDGPVSGDVLARESGQTRAAVWKRVEALREAGVPVEALAGRGYRLTTPVELLDAGMLRAALARCGMGPVALDIAWSLDSTNTQLLRQARDAEGVRVLLAERQTAGRGRRGRDWTSPLGANLYLSVARRFHGGLARLGGLSLVAGIAVAEALRGHGFDAVGLKWPNDLVVPTSDGHRKLGGLLVEGGGEHGGPVLAVIGVGINVRMPGQPGIDQPWTDLAALRPDASRNAVAAAVLCALLPALECFDADGLAPFLARWSALDVLGGRAVQLHGNGATRNAHVLGLDSDGALRVRLDDGTEASVHSGEVSVRACT